MGLFGSGKKQEKYRFIEEIPKKEFEFTGDKRITRKATPETEEKVAGILQACEPYVGGQKDACFDGFSKGVDNAIDQLRKGKIRRA